MAYYRIATWLGAKLISVKALYRKVGLLPAILFVAAAAVLIAGAIVAWRQWQNNQQKVAEIKHSQYRANHGHATGKNPSTERPTRSAFAQHQVAPKEPRYIYIPKIGVKAMVKQVGLTEDGALGAPANIYNTAWYSGSAKPGQPGATVIDGHVSYWRDEGVFADLDQLTKGDLVKIERGDGAKLTYKVVAKQVYPYDHVDMQKALSPIGSARTGLNLITCTGQVVGDSNNFNQRLVVFTKLVESTADSSA